MHRYFLACLTIALVSSWALPSVSATATKNTPTQRKKEVKVNPHALREMLVKGLKVTRKDEEKYIDSVVERVMDGKLAVSIVYASFRYARTRRPHYPYPYFVYSVETLAKKQAKNQR